MSVQVYSWGLVSLSACAPKDMPIADVTREMNAQHPTGISSKWDVSDEKTFASGQPMPCPCESDADRLHYLFHC